MTEGTSTQNTGGSGMPPGVDNKKVLAGVLAIVLGGLGIHKFVL